MWILDICQCPMEMLDIHYSILFLRLFEHDPYSDSFLIGFSKSEHQMKFLEKLKKQEGASSIEKKCHFYFYENMNNIPYECIESHIKQKENIEKKDILCLMSDFDEIVASFTLYQIKRSAMVPYPIKIQLIPFIYSFQYISLSKKSTLEVILIPWSIWMQLKKMVREFSQLRMADFHIFEMSGWKLEQFDREPDDTITEKEKSYGLYSFPKFTEIYLSTHIDTKKEEFPFIKL